MVEQCKQRQSDTCTQFEANRGDGGELREQPEVVAVCQLNSASQFIMPIQVGESVVDTVVDTASRQMSMQGFIAGPVGNSVHGGMKSRSM